jgi:ureidoacrylate peracid hydrolase
MTFTPGVTGLLVIDPYNDFISEGGKVYAVVVATEEVIDAIPSAR